MQKLNDIVDLDTYPIENTAFGERCLNILKSEGVLTLPGFLRENVS